MLARRAGGGLPDHHLDRRSNLPAAARSREGRSHAKGISDCARGRGAHAVELLARPAVEAALAVPAQRRGGSCAGVHR